MKYKHPKPVGKLRNSSVRRYTQAGSAAIEATLSTILNDLARILVTSGYGIDGLHRLSKKAYFDAALALDAGAGRKISKARIAALTGLTRVDVTQLSIRPRDNRGKSPIPVNRAQRVSFGWASDLKYCDKQGRPSVLPFRGRGGSFQRLVKTYSGDIPARAMLTEMVRLGMVVSEANESIRLLRLDSPIARRTTTSLRALSPWISFLANSEDNDLRQLTANTIRLELGFESLPQLFASVRDLQGRATSFVDSIRELSSKEARVKRHKLYVSIALATRVPQASDS